MTMREMFNSLKGYNRDLLIANSNLAAKVNILEEKLKIAEDYIDKYKELVNQQNDAIDKLDARLKEILNGNS